MSSLKTIEKGQPGLYVLGWPLPGGHSLPRVDFRRGFAIPVISRVGGVLLAVPLDFLPQEALVSGLSATAETILGPSITIEAPAVEEDEVGEEIESEVQIALLLVDFLRDVERGLSEFDPDSRATDIRHFLPDAPELLPSSSSLLNAALEWSHIPRWTPPPLGGRDTEEADPKKISGPFASFAHGFSPSGCPEAKEGDHSSFGRSGGFVGFLDTSFVGTGSAAIRAAEEDGGESGSITCAGLSSTVRDRRTV